MSNYFERSRTQVWEEALTNYNRWVRLTKERRLVTMVIEDNGRGFDVGAVGGRKGRHFGLNIMRERAESVNGTLEISSDPGEGTRVVAKIPVEERSR